MVDGLEVFKNLEEIISKFYDGGMFDSKVDRLRLMVLFCKCYLKQDYSIYVVNDLMSDIFFVFFDYC